jgi:hypothetical protein
MNRFIILGERCSGTNFVQHALTQNFNLEYDTTYQHLKHFFGFDPAGLASLSPDRFEAGDTLIVCVIRDAVNWVDSFFKRLHHVPDHLKTDADTFVTQEWYSIYELDGLDPRGKPVRIGDEIMEDRDWETHEQYPNLLTLRRRKQQWMMEILPRLVPPHQIIYVRYEDLRDDYAATLERLRVRARLMRRSPDVPYTPITQYKGTYWQPFAVKPILLPIEIQTYIREHVDAEQEEQLLRLCRLEK